MDDAIDEHERKTAVRENNCMSSGTGGGRPCVLPVIDAYGARTFGDRTMVFRRCRAQLAASRRSTCGFGLGATEPILSTCQNS